MLDEQFIQLRQLQDDSSPNFVYEVVTIYFRESEKLLRNLRALLYVPSIFPLIRLYFTSTLLINLTQTLVIVVA